MRLHHFTKDPELKLEPRVYPQRPEAIGKPRGFWLSYEENNNGWFDFCIDQNFALDGLTYVYEVDVEDTLLPIRGLEDLKILKELYPRRLLSFETTFPLETPIDWWKVAKYYPGVSFIPYDFNFRYAYQGYAWYNTIDCESAVVWDTTAIRSMKKVGEAHELCID